MRAMGVGLAQYSGEVAVCGTFSAVAMHTAYACSIDRRKLIGLA